MNALQHCLDRLQPEPLACVAHVGSADKPLLGWVLSRHALRVALAPGNADWAEGFSLAGERPAPLQVFDRPVLAQAGSVEWSSYTLSEANGPLEPAGLRQLYPRLHLLERATVRALALAEWLTSLQVVVDPAAANLLVLDCPGLEVDMLGSLPDEVLRAFEWVLVRSARPGLLEGACSPEAATALMQRRFYLPQPLPPQEGELWPAGLYRFSASACELHAMAAGRDQQATLAAERLAALQAVQQELQAARALVLEQQSSLDQLQAAQHEAQRLGAMRAELADQNAALASQNAELVHQKAQMERERAESVAKAAEQLATLQQVTRSRDEQQKYANERYKKIAQLDAEMAELQARHALLKEELAKAEAHVELMSELLLKETAQ